MDVCIRRTTFRALAAMVSISLSALSGCGGGQTQETPAPARIAVAVPPLQTDTASNPTEPADPDDPAAYATEAPAEVAAAAVTVAAGGAAAKDKGSPQPPYPTSVIVKYHATSFATVGQTFEVVLDFSQVTSRGAKVEISGDAKLVLTGATPFKLKEGETVSTFRATAVAPGRSLIYVYARQGTGATAIAIPIEIEPA